MENIKISKTKGFWLQKGNSIPSCVSAAVVSAHYYSFVFDNTRAKIFCLNYCAIERSKKVKPQKFNVFPVFDSLADFFTQAPKNRIRLILELKSGCYMSFTQNFN